MGESVRAAQAWADYEALGPGRSLEKLLKEYRSRTGSVPTRQLSRLKCWSVDHNWQGRLRDLAEKAAREAEEREAAYRRSILEDGYGLHWERVRALKALAETLLADLTEGGKRWVTEPKQIGSGPTATVVELERFNAAEVEQFRGVLDDIAKEKRERKGTLKVTGKDGGPIEHADADADARRVEAVHRLLDRARARVTGPADGGQSDLDAAPGATNRGVAQ
jgi:hypothetical protein